MADFSIPFARDASKRLATAGEKTAGFPCGPADQELFNGLMNQLQAEMNTVFTQAGVQQNDSVFTTLYQAIAALIIQNVTSIQFASIAESIAGAITDKAVNPRGLQASFNDFETSAPWAQDIINVVFASIAEHLVGTIANKAATPAGVAAVVSRLVASSPDALNTLNELAQALGDDANFSTTVNTALSARVRTNGSTPFTNVQTGVNPGGTPNDTDLATVRWVKDNTASGNVDFASIVEHLAGVIANKAATPAGVKSVVDALIDASPGALNTLDELAAALGDDANFATTVNTALANRIRINGSTPFTDVQRGVTPGNNANDLDLVTVQFLNNNAAIAPISLSSAFTVSNVDVTRTLSRVITNYNYIDIIYKESIFGLQSTKSKLVNLAIQTVVLPYTLYAINNTNDSLYSINEATGAAALIGALGSGDWDSLAALGGTLYAINNTNDSLYSINEATGVAALIGALGSGDWNSLAGLGGTLYAINNTNNSLYSINEATGVAALIGALGRVVIGIVLRHWEVLCMQSGRTNNSLYSIDETTGVAALIGALGSGGNWDSLAALGGTLYAINNTNDSLYSINETTGVAALIGALGISGNWESLAALGGTSMAFGSLLRLSDIKGLMAWRPAGTDNQLTFRRAGTTNDIEVLDIIGIT